MWLITHDSDGTKSVQYCRGEHYLAHLNSYMMPSVALEERRVGFGDYGFLQTGGGSFPKQGPNAKFTSYRSLAFEL